LSGRFIRTLSEFFVVRAAHQDGIRRMSKVFGRENAVLEMRFDTSKNAYAFFSSLPFPSGTAV
jgi:hypothetical protein